MNATKHLSRERKVGALYKSIGLFKEVALKGCGCTKEKKAKTIPPWLRQTPVAGSNPAAANLREEKVMDSNIYELDLHETMIEGDFMIMRVPGGWIYERRNLNGHEKAACVFVPYNNDMDKGGERG